MGTDLSDEASLEIERSRVLRHIYNSIGNIILGMFSVLKDLGNGLFNVSNHHIIKEFFKNTIPIMCVVIVIGMVIGIIFGTSKKKKNKSSPQMPTIFNPLSYIGNMLPMPTYKMKLFSYNFAPYGNTVDTSISERPIIKRGRCDNLKNYELTSKNICLNTSNPEPIVWTLDIEKMPELTEISVATKNIVDGGADAQKYTVTIPWAKYKNDGVYYYPDCKKATFGNGDSAAYLFTDNGTRSCEKKTVNRTNHTVKQRPVYLSSNFVSIADFSS